MSRLLTGIDLKTLPKTFRHAVQISRRLGFRYLWIDALCILQDSIEDWRNEASKMGSVYEYSTCTIAAVWGRNSHSGCFNDRQPLKQYPCCVQLDSTGPLYLHDLDYVKDIHSENNVEGLGFSRRYESIPPLHTRAWVVQERFLAPRTIFFGSNVISWECREGTANELRPKIEREEHNPKECYQYFTNPLTPLQDEENRVAFYRNWNVFLWLYTAGRLTKEQDRLVALAGVVSQVEKHTGLTNIFGLWKELLPMELLWGRDLGPDGTLRIPPPKKTRAPSWSWASQDGPVNVEQSVGWESCVSEIVCETISSISIPTTKYPCISLLGHLVLFSGRIHTASVGINGYCELSHDEHKRKLEFTPDVPGAWEDDVKFDCYLLLVASTDSDEVFPGSVYEKGLVLSKRPSGRFARTGVFLNFLQTVDETGLFQKHRGERERITIE
ncbi:heterokaryon incompatibility protein-domain-containing protein [Amylocarpus encephaloides]|uniref:Heterokaryon incompatibility protein-domain-containing protein n=1 Tax=Amylocarpus encephaloides TaxID=45428 RepID=A0A9P8C0D6_9HELO|nr:heterokaryon incompatibility protein-domain-containing protein [Amylocarpus encephaloides]